MMQIAKLCIPEHLFDETSTALLVPSFKTVLPNWYHSTAIAETKPDDCCLCTCVPTRPHHS